MVRRPQLAAARGRPRRRARLTLLGRLPISYVLPIRWQRDQGLDELTGYLAGLVGTLDEVIVVDGSPPERFGAHARRLPRDVRHMPPASRDSLMGKVDGVLTGLSVARNECVVIADDDVRWTSSELARAGSMLELEPADVVRPQNYFDPLPWHARVDTARSLLNRVWSGERELGPGDFPGTLVVRRSALERTGGYDGDVMFENLELMRTVIAAGGRVATPLDLYVPRRPPDATHHLSQRIRQAYDDFAIPPRMALWLSIVPAVAISPRRARVVGAICALSVAVAEAGRRRAGGRVRFPLSSALLAPVWVAERAICAWLALWQRLRGGVSYAGQRIPRSASSLAELRSRTDGSARSASPSAAPSA
jgi:hypothetical protein